MHPESEVVAPALRAIGNIVAGDEEETQSVISSGVLPPLYTLLHSDSRNLRKEACWTISNITAGTVPQVQCILEAGMFPQIIQCLATDEPRVQKEAAWAVANAVCSGTPEQTRALVMLDCIAPLCAQLKLDTETRVLTVVLNAIKKILKVGQQYEVQDGGFNRHAYQVEECKGHEAIENMQRHDYKTIYQLANSIIVRYFGAGEEEGEVVDLQPDTGLNKYFDPNTPAPSNFSF